MRQAWPIVLSICTGGLVAIALLFSLVEQLAPTVRTESIMKQITFTPSVRGLHVQGVTQAAALLRYPARITMGDQVVVSLSLTGWVTARRAQRIDAWRKRAGRPFEVALENEPSRAPESVKSSLRAPDFVKDPPGEDIQATMTLLEPVEWTWVLTPKSTGIKNMAITVDASGESPVFNDWRVSDASLNDVRLSAKTITFKTEVVNEWGMTRRQEKTVQTFDAIAALLGTMMSFPLWSWLFGRRKAVG
jgi:hypothetical protein